MSFVLEYLGKPWVAGARGPDAFDCWGLVYHVYKTQLGIELPQYNITPSIESARLINLVASTSNERSDWLRLKKPEHLCVVGMGARFVTHVGVYIAADEGLVLHCIDGHKVIADTVPTLKIGFRMGRIEFFRYGASRTYQQSV